MSQELVAAEDISNQTIVAKRFSLDKVELQWGEFLLRRERQAADKKWLDEFKPILKKLAGDADEYMLRGRKVAIVVPGQFNLSWLSREQPALVEEYTRFVTERKFDEEGFKKENPELWEQYRARRLTLAAAAPVMNGLS